MEASALLYLAVRLHSIMIDPFMEEDDPLDFMVWLDTAFGGGSEPDSEELAELEAHLVQMTEDRLDHGHLLEHEVETTALDDFYSRSHWKSSQASNHPTLLVVGSLQGSGNRAVVDALLQLQVPMITLDHPTNGHPTTAEMRSFHIGQMAWRNMIQIVMESGIHSANYDFSSLPTFQQIRLRQEWEKLYQGYIAKQLPESVSHQEGHPSNILFSFEAHDALLMLPVIQELVLGPLKFIHVVRDGRDVSLLNSRPETAVPSSQVRRPNHSMGERFGLETFYDVLMHNTSTTSGSEEEEAEKEEQYLQFDRKRVIESMQLWRDVNRDSQA